MAAQALSVPEVAALLGVRRERVQALIRRGQLRGQKVGNRWNVSRKEVDRWQRIVAPRGRPLSASAAWEIIAQGSPPSRESERELLRRRLRARAEHASGFIHPSMLRELRNSPSVMISGREAADIHEVPAGGNDNELNAYVMKSEFDSIRARRLFDENPSDPNVEFHVVDDDDWPFGSFQRVAPLFAVWLDLADAGDRSASLVLDRLLSNSQNAAASDSRN